MLVAEVIDGVVTQVADCKDLCEWWPPTDEQLRDRNLVRVNLFREYDPKTERLVPCDPELDGDWVYMMKMEKIA